MFLSCKTLLPSLNSTKIIDKDIQFLSYHGTKPEDISLEPIWRDTGQSVA